MSRPLRTRLVEAAQLGLVGGLLLAGLPGDALRATQDRRRRRRLGSPAERIASARLAHSIAPELVGEVDDIADADEDDFVSDVAFVDYAGRPIVLVRATAAGWDMLFDLRRK
jgi:hypothetical protein